MTKREFEQKKAELKPINDFLNWSLLLDMLIGLGTIIWLIWGAGSPGWKLLLTTVVLFFFILVMYGLFCYKYYQDGAENILVDEYDEELNENQPINQHNEERTERQNGGWFDTD